MPNWAYSTITISGSQELIKSVREQLSRPYPDPHNPDRSITGDFLLWNIISPDDLERYLGEDLKDKPFTEDTDIMAQIMHEMDTGMGWYNWNCRNWGTKWETQDEHGILEHESTTPNPLGDYTLTYRVTSAWSPPTEALYSLAQQFPTASILLDSIDESDCWAMTGGWGDGELSFCEDIPITHDLHISLTGYCYACDDISGDDFDEYAEARAELGCPNE